MCINRPKKAIAFDADFQESLDKEVTMLCKAKMSIALARRRLVYFRFFFLSFQDARQVKSPSGKVLQIQKYISFKYN